MHSVLGLLALAHHVLGAAIYQAPLKKIESVRTRMIRSGSWPDYVKERKAMRTELVLNRNTYPHPVILDTGSANLWVPDKKCVRGLKEVCEQPKCAYGMICTVFCPNKLCCDKELRINRKSGNPCQGKDYFDSAKSSSYAKLVNRTEFEIRFGERFAKGFFGNDTVRFGAAGSNRLIVPGTVFGQAESIGRIFARNPIGGILGLGFRSLAVGGVNPPFQQAVDLGLVEPIFSVYLKRLGVLARGEYGGVFTYGGLDKENCGDVIAYENLSKAMFWQFRLKEFNAGKLKLTDGWEAISDTSTSSIGVPSAIANQIATSVGAEYDFFYEVYVINCNSTVTFNLTIGSNVYVIEPTNLIAKGEIWCSLRLVSLGSSGGFGPQWVLGTPFIRQYCNIYDVGNKKIGFARPLKK
ncbi:unnamed protein product [Haemonchus placei]|uniref:Peptidase A1 domain-containing protein n=1 Tax=Haemonchus placei TaxID=6290 RepID=A0A0N4WDU6_HAEPC|nr:unnamed protein product [Haemonchus placei]